MDIRPSNETTSPAKNFLEELRVVVKNNLFSFIFSPSLKWIEGASEEF